MCINKDDIKDYCEILLEMESRTSGLPFTCWEMLKNKGVLDNAIANLENMVNESSSELLKTLIKTGFIPKCLLQLLYTGIDIHKETIWIENFSWKREHFVCLCSDKDNYRQIFNSHTTWYFVPSLILYPVEIYFQISMKKNIEEDIYIYFLLKKINKFYCHWLPIVLFEFCHQSSVVIHGNYCCGSVGQIIVKLHCDIQKKILHLLIIGSNNKERKHAKLLKTAIHMFLKHNSVHANFVFPSMGLSEHPYALYKPSL